MEYRRLGRSGLAVSELAYGNWLTHGSQVEEDAARTCVNAALDVGITTFDTSDTYANTRAESVLGRCLAGMRRESLVISTKVWGKTGPGGPNDSGLGRKHIMESAAASLQRLRTDHIDIYTAHRFDPTVPLEETFGAFADLVRQGRVCYIGVSEWTAEQISQAAALARELRIPLISSQPQYSMLWRVPEQSVIPMCEREGLGQIVWSPLAQGVLSGKYKPGQPPPAGSRATDDKGGSTWIANFLKEDIIEKVAQLQPLADDAGLSMSQLALGWVLKNSNVGAAIIGASRPEQVIENAKAVDADLDDGLMTKIDSILGDVVVREAA